MRCVFQFYRQKQPKKQEQDEADFWMKKQKDARKHLKTAYMDNR